VITVSELLHGVDHGQPMTSHTGEQKVLTHSGAQKTY